MQKLKKSLVKAWERLKSHFDTKEKRKTILKRVLAFGAFWLILGMYMANYALPFSDGRLPGNYYQSGAFENIFTPYTVIVPNSASDDRGDFISSSNFSYQKWDTVSGSTPVYDNEIGLSRLYSLMSSTDEVRTMMFANGDEHSFYQNTVSYASTDIEEYAVYYEDFFTSYAAFPYILSLVNPLDVEFGDVSVSLTAYYQTVNDDDYVTKSLPISFDLTDTYLPDLSSTIMSWVRNAIRDDSVYSKEGVYITDMVIYYKDISVLGPSSSLLDFNANNFVAIDEDILDNGRGNEGTLTGYGLRLPTLLYNSNSNGITGLCNVYDTKYDTFSPKTLTSIQYYLSSSYSQSYMIYNGTYVYRGSWNNDSYRYIRFGESTVINSDNVDALRNLIIYGGANFGYYEGDSPARGLTFINRYENPDDPVNTPNEMINSIATSERINVIESFSHFVFDTIDSVMNFKLGWFKLGEIVSFVIGLTLTIWFLKVVLGG